MSVLRMLVIGGMALSCTAGYAQTRCPEDKRADDHATRFVIGAGSVKMPIGAFLLVRKGFQIGAIRVTSIDSAATEWFGKFTYESFFQPDGSGSFVAKNVDRRTGELNVQRPKGPGRGIYIYQPGPYKAQVGKWIFPFWSPTLMAMSDISFWSGVGDRGYEFAPTSACNLSEIDVQDKRLKWFRFDRNASFTLQLSELPK